ncbi:glycosyltransferase [Bosea sp. (in: a-proteobacteria)]|jgi:glycosyltransferase involved in cell wall biosynthesis|uniref:glycosyltransferase n=1 Tax=Bosea sp. (in: a-proteobacteria) TaxID=1871050 RepID=UPI0035618F90
MDRRETVKVGQPMAPASRMSSARGQRVLIIESDLFKTIGGGQSAYRKIIEQTPQNTYFYFLKTESVDAARPANAVGIPYMPLYGANMSKLPSDAEHFYWVYLNAWQFAASVERKLGADTFDVVDTPDYDTVGLFIRGALEAHGIKVGVVALALHGTISSALADIWPHTAASSRTMAQLRIREHLQYRSVDVRYALSEAYAADWQGRSGIASRLIDPLHITGPMSPVMAPMTADLPDVAFIGRRERRKGPDLFADFAWCLDPASYGKAMVIGSESISGTGIGSEPTLEMMTRLRQIKLDYELHKTPAELTELFRSRSIVVLPSRYDQFNLVALEAFRHGCPTYISRHAGAAQWLGKHYPALSELVIDIDCSRSAAARIRNALADYDGVRERVVTALLAYSPAIDGEDLAAMYTPLGLRDQSSTQNVAEIRHRFDSFSRPRRPNERSVIYRARNTAAKTLPPAAKRGLREVKARLRTAKRSLVTIRRWRPSLGPINHLIADGLVKFRNLEQSSIAQIRSAAAVDGTRARLLGLDERTSKEVALKLKEISAELGPIRVARVQVIRDMARLERKRDNDLIAATYCLRVMRWLGSDRFGDLDFVTQTLRSANYLREAEAAEAMFGPGDDVFERSRALLDEQYRANLVKPDLPLAILDDRRSGAGESGAGKSGAAAPKVSVIVSLYNAETKLRTLLDNISAQSLARDGQIEVVLVDSASPTKEYEVFKDYAAQSALPIVFARSEQRETIQAAWNRGIKLANAPYLTFLGADEGMHPDCLLALAGALDQNPRVDWAMADSIVTEVDKAGVFNHDVMVYDRTGFNPGLIRLETCYLSWVAGLYRKTVHDRFGYYDEKFRAAGDTEFKGRLLTHINALHVPKRLGVFNNYPEERTTQNPRAEIEDLRAWYLHRTEAGIAYSYDARPAVEAEDLFRQSLTYRKSYCGHYSTDFDLAAATAAYLVRRGENPDFARAAMHASARLLDAVQRTDTLNLQLRRRVRQMEMLRTLLDAKSWEAEDQIALNLTQRPHYNIFNDNRYEQHWWSWST